MSDSSTKYLIINNDELIFSHAFKHINLYGDRLYESYRQYFTDNSFFVSGIFLHNGKYYGTLVEKLRIVNRKTSDNFVISCKGINKVEITSFIRGKTLFDFDFCEVAPLPLMIQRDDDFTEESSYVTKINELILGLKDVEALKPFFVGVNQLTDDSIEDWVNSNSMLFDRERQEQLFVCDNTLDAVKIIYDGLKKKEFESRIDDDIIDKVNEDINKDQKEYYLRTQLKIINKELNGDDELDEYRSLVESSAMPEEIKEKLYNEIAKISTLMPGSPEAYVTRNYVELVTSLPWGVYSKDNNSIENARKVLNEDHYGIESVKDRVIEALAVRRLVNHNRGNILCFYGPPGTGKTSVVKSIARALNRKYVRISLGGMHDEAEIRGHRRTYLASMPGKIIKGIKSAGTMNPVFLMDEIDKLSNDYKGDPASALLEVLDPEQNKAFVDNFLDIPFDLSDVLFVTTANDISQIAKPLLDRMELIEMGSYTTEEKEQIAIRYLIPKQLKENGLSQDSVIFRKSAVNDIILNYTLEAGVRGLEQKIAKICRKIVANFGDKKVTKYVVTSNRLVELLGARSHRNENIRPNEVGVITGLAYTQYGGTTMDIEALLCVGKGELKLTGSLGDVMKESATQAYTLVKSRAEQYGIDTNLFQKDLHINAVECAVPKDGPSAGIALATVILSAYTGKKIRSDIALTGEITLSGRVLAIGGIKEKSMGAINRGIKKIVLPKANEQDVEKLPDSIKDKIQYTFVENIDEVFKEMIVDET